MDPDSAALFLTTRRLAASGGTQPTRIQCRSPPPATRRGMSRCTEQLFHITSRRWAAALTPLTRCREPWSLVGWGCAWGGWLAQGWIPLPETRGVKALQKG